MWKASIILIWMASKSSAKSTTSLPGTLFEGRRHGQNEPSSSAKLERALVHRGILDENWDLCRKGHGSFDENVTSYEKVCMKCERTEHIECLISSLPATPLFIRGGAAPWKVAAVKNQAKSTVTNTGSENSTNALKERAKIGFYFGLWYVLNVMYNIMNKKLMNVIPAPLTLGTLQLFIGGAYAAALWLLKIRAAPKLTPEGKTVCRSVGFYHGAGQLASMASMGAGPISFTHIVKALEPFFSAVCSAFIFGKWFPWQVYATLVPVVGGVGYACMQEPQFSWLAFLSAMGSNLAFALRAVVSKSAMSTYIGENISSTNLFGVVTLYSAVLMVPFALAVEKTSIISLWKSALDTSGKTQHELVRAVLVSGLFHYLNNEVMYLALGNVHPVTLAVGNTMKRVFILVASVLVFRNPVSIQAAIGSAIGISGVLLYSLAKAHYEKLEQK